MKRKADKKNKTISKGIRTVLGEGTQFSGTLTFDGTVRIDGCLEGEVISEGTLFIGDRANIHADITIGSIVVCGKLSGNIIASQSVLLKHPGEVFGNIRSPVISIEEGVVFQGTCDMEKKASASSIAFIVDQEDQISDQSEMVQHLVESTEG